MGGRVRGRHVIGAGAREYEERRRRAAYPASSRPFIAASIARASDWLSRNLTHVRDVIGTSSDFPAWPELEPWVLVSRVPKVPAVDLDPAA